MKVLDKISVVAVICLVAISYQLILFLRESRQDAHLVASDTHIAMRKADDVLGKFGAVENRELEASASQIAAFQKFNQEVLKVAAKVNDLTGHLDVRLNGTDTNPSLGLIPAAKDAVTQTIALQQAVLSDTGDATKHLDETMDLLRPGLASFNTAAASLPPFLQNLTDTAANTKTITAETAATMTDVHKGVDFEVNQLMKPVNKIKAAVLFLGTLAGRIFL